MFSFLRRLFRVSKTYYVVVSEFDSSPDDKDKGGPMLWEQYLSHATDIEEAEMRRRMLGPNFGRTYIAKLKFYKGDYVDTVTLPDDVDPMAPKVPVDDVGPDANGVFHPPAFEDNPPQDNKDLVDPKEF